MTISAEVIPISSQPNLFKCAVLRIEDRHILLDCGWTENLDVNLLSPLTESPLMRLIDAVVITHPDLAHCGALPYLIKHFKLKAPVYATEAAKRLGELSLASLHEDLDAVKEATSSDGEYLLNLSDIVSSFQSVIPLQYGEVCNLFNDLTITPQPAGRLLGGAYWRFNVPSGQHVLYCVDYCLSTERVLPGLSFSPATSPALLVTDVGSEAVVARAVGSGYSPAEENLLQSILSTLRQNGTVLLPVDASGRVLELLCLLEEFWTSEPGLSSYPLIFLSPLGDVVLDQAKTRLEWLNRKVRKEFDDSAAFTFNPFFFTHVKLCPSFAEFSENFPQRAPKVVLAPSHTLEMGDGRECFFRLAPEPQNLIIFTQASGLPSGCLADRLLLDVGKGAARVYREQQGLKVAQPDERLREFYREALQKEMIDDELRRRRLRERRQQMIGEGVGPEYQLPLPSIDLTSLPAGFEGVSGERFFRPRLFFAQTLTAAAAGVNPNPGSNLDEYGERITAAEVDTWRAHANAEGLAGAGEIEDDQPQQIKQVKRAKEEVGGVKGEDEKMPLEEMRGDTFDWRRDLHVRFGEPKRCETRERQVRVACRIKLIQGLDGQSSLSQRREFYYSVRASNIIFLPSENRAELQLVHLRSASLGTRVQVCQEEYEEGESSLSTIPRSVNLHAKRKLVHLDPTVLSTLHFTQLGPRGPMVAALTSDSVEFAIPADAADILRTPSGAAIDNVLCPSTLTNSRLRRKSLFLTEKRIRIADLKERLESALPGADLSFAGPVGKRGVLIEGEGGEVEISRDTEGELTITANGLCPNFYAVRKALYANYPVV